MTDHNASKRTQARNAAVTRRYARVWKAIISGDVPARGDDIDTWYASAQHALGFCVHAAAVDRFTAVEESPDDDVKSAA
jgi:hypothetical protein